MTMPLRPLGGTGLTVSPLGFGCMRLPVIDNNPEKIDKPAAMKMLGTAIDAGVNYLDTAYPYHCNNFPGAGQSEPFVGEFLAGRDREKLLVATKLPLWNVKTREDMDRLLNEQLRRMGLEYFDVYLAHNFNANSWPRTRDLGILPFLEAARADGRIRHIGFSFHDSYALFEEIMGSFDWELAQIQYNYLDVSAQAGRRGLRLAADKGAAVVVMEPLRGGFLINRIPAEMKERLRSVRPEWSLADWALRWLWSQPEVGLVLSGMSTQEQTEENIRIAGGAPDFGPREAEALETVRRWFEDRLKVGCTSCGYCLPCPEGVAIPKVFGWFNNYYMSEDATSRQRAKMIYSSTVAEGEKAERCVGCGACETRCPQGLEISRLMPEVAELFDQAQA